MVLVGTLCFLMVAFACIVSERMERLQVERLVGYKFKWPRGSFGVWGGRMSVLLDGWGPLWPWTGRRSNGVSLDDLHHACIIYLFSCIDSVWMLVVAQECRDSLLGDWT